MNFQKKKNIFFDFLFNFYEFIYVFVFLNELKIKENRKIKG